MSNWERFTKKYVWDDDKTPFFIAVDKLTKLQANREVFLYVVFVATPFAILGVVSLAGVARYESAAYLLSLAYSFSVVAAAYYVNSTKHRYAAFYTATAPLALLLHFVVNGFPSKLHEIEQGGILVFLMLWLRYAMRIISIAKRYPEMREGVAKPPHP